MTILKSSHSPQGPSQPDKCLVRSFPQNTQAGCRPWATRSPLTAAPSPHCWALILQFTPTALGSPFSHPCSPHHFTLDVGAQKAAVQGQQFCPILCLTALRTGKGTPLHPRESPLGIAGKHMLRPASKKGRQKFNPAQSLLHIYKTS